MSNRFELLDAEEGGIDKKSKKVVDAPAKKQEEQGGLKENHARVPERSRGGRFPRGGRGAQRHGGFDRHSGTGRDAVSKRGDAGAHNWGAKGAEVDVQQAPVEGAQAEVPAEPAQPEEEEEEPETGISFDEVMARRAANRVDDDEKLNAREKGEGEDDGEEYEILSKEDEPIEGGEVFGAVAAKVKKAKKKDAKVNNSVSLEEFAKDLPIKRNYDGPRGGRGGRGGRGRGRGNFRGGDAPRNNYRQPAAKVDLGEAAFPALGGR
jgi:hypothetical protein